MLVWWRRRRRRRRLYVTYVTFVWTAVFRSANWTTLYNDSFQLTSLELVNIASGYPQISNDSGM